MITKSGNDDMHFKMCKKIAQLTKVIYKLNTQNEDNETWTLQLRRKHEEEVRTLCSDAERRMEELQKALAESEKRSKAAVETVQQQYKTELSEAKDAYARKLESMTDELLASKKRFEEVIAEAKKKSEKKVSEEVAKLLAAKDEELVSLKTRKDTEIAELVREYNDRYKSMLAEQMDARDRLEESARSLQSRLDDAIATHTAEVQEWAKKLKVAEAAAADATAELAKMRESNIFLETDRNRLQKECEALRGRLDAEISSHGVSRDAETLVRQEVEELRRQLGETQAGRDGIERILNERTAALEKTLSNLTDMENKKSLLETELCRYKADAAAAEQENQQLREQMAMLERRVAELQEAATIAAEKMERRCQTEQSLEERCNELRREMDLLIKKHQEELAELRASHESALLVMNSASQKSSNMLMEKLREEREKLENDHLKVLRNLNEQHNQQMSQLKKEHEGVVSDLRHQLEGAGGVEATLRATIAELQQHVVEAERKLTEAFNAVQAADAHEKDLIAKYEAIIEDLKKQLATMEACTSAKVCAEREANEEKIRKLEAELDKVRAQYMSESHVNKSMWENNLRSQAEEHEQVLRKLRLEHGEQIQRLNKAQLVRIAELQTEHQKELEQCSLKARRELEKERQKLFQAQTELSSELRRCEEALRQSREQTDAIRQSAKEQATRLSEEVRALKEHVANITGDVESLQAEVKSTTAALQLSQTECAELKKFLSSAEKRIGDLTSAYKQLEESTNRSRLEVDALHKEYVASIEKRHAQKLQSALDELRAVMTAERDAAQYRADEALSLMRQKHGESQEEVKNLKIKLDTLTCDLQKSLEEVRREQLNVESVKKTFADTVEGLRRDFAAEKDYQQRLTEQHLNEIATKHRVIVDDLMRQHSEKEMAQNALLKELQAELDDLRHRYEYRESRAEDVTMINNLIKEGRQKDQALKKAMNDLKMYKLELINREENYNKVFGRQPRVASGMSADKKQLQRY